MTSLLRTLGLLCLPFTLLQAGDEPLLNTPGKVISAPDFKTPLGPEWTVTKGEWKPADGVLTANELPDEHHAAVLHLATGPVDLVLECDFRLGKGKIFYVGCDSARHVGRVVIMPKNIKLCEDSTEVKGKSPSHTLAESNLNLNPEEWQHLRVEYAGDQMAARLNNLTLNAQHPYLATAKVRWWFAASGTEVQLRNVRFSEGQPLEKK
jgi:hypothetical protein